MSESTESEEITEEGVAEAALDDTVEIDVDHLIDDLEKSGGNGNARQEDQPAWRRVEDYIERKRAEKELNDLYDFDIDLD